MTRDQVERVRTAIETVATEAEATLSSRDGHEGLKSAAVFGLGFLKDELLDAFNVQAFAADEPAANMLSAMEGFCYGHCYFGQRAQPGEHKKCDGCPIRRFTVGAMERAADTAFGGES